MREKNIYFRETKNNETFRESLVLRSRENWRIFREKYRFDRRFLNQYIQPIDYFLVYENIIKNVYNLDQILRTSI